MSAWNLGVAAALSGVAVACALSPPRKPVLARERARWPSPRRTDESQQASAEPSGTEPRGSLLRALASMAAGLGAVLLVGGWLGVVIGVAAGTTVWRVLGRMEPAAVRRRRERLVRGLPHAVDLMASSLSVGSSPTTAVELVAAAVDQPVRDELEMIAGRLALGVDPVRVWSEVARHPQLGALGRCLVRAIDSGSSVSDAMHRLAEDLRRTARADVEARARAVGVKAAAPLGLCLLPAFILTGVVPLVAGSVAMLLGR